MPSDAFRPTSTNSNHYQFVPSAGATNGSFTGINNYSGSTGFSPVQSSYNSSNTTTLHFVPSGESPSCSMEFDPSDGSTTKPKVKRRTWTAVETTVFLEIYEESYINGTLSSKTSKENAPGWEDLKSQVNKAFAERNIAPRSMN